MDQFRPATPQGSDGLAAVLADPAGCLLALDFDGTLAPIVLDPTTSRMPDETAAALTRLAALVGQIAIVTGRPAEQVVELGRLDRIDRVVVEGQYGAQHWEAGAVTAVPPPPGIEALRGELPDLLADADPGVWIEDKGLGLVVHTRRTPDPAGELDRLRDRLISAADRHGLHAEGGRYVVEMRIPGIDKGEALIRLVREHRARSVLYAGDDLGDLPAFAAVDTLRSDGVPGLTVCSASGDVPEVEERADLLLDGPGGVSAFLQQLADALAETPA